jgi:guanylate kinase
MAMIENNNGILFIVAAPSGGGKTSLVKKLVEQQENIEVSISHTTRPQRHGEEDGVHYFFVNDETFLQMVEKKQFIEHAKVFNYYYGTSVVQLQEKLAKGIDVVLDIDWQGAKQLKEQFKHVVTIFIVPPSLEVLRQRLIERGRDDERVIQQRMQEAQSEISHYDEFDYLIVNEDFTQAANQLQAIITAERLKIAKQKHKNAKILSFLLGKV